MSEKRYFKIEYDEEWYLFDSTTISEQLVKEQAEYGYGVFANSLSPSEVVDLLNEQQELIEELQVSDEMGWKRAEHFEKKCPKELHNKKMYIKRLEYKVQKFKEENEKLQKENNDYEKQFRIINEKLDEYIKTADTYRIPISSLKYGDELGYFNGVYQYMKKLKKDIGGIFK